MKFAQYPPIDKAELAAMFRLDESAGHLVWVQPPKNHPRMLGKIAGHARPPKDGKQYVRVKINGIPYLRSRLVFCLHYGRWPVGVIDHVNGNSLDDRPSNLRDIEPVQNAWNHVRRTEKRSSLPAGVSYNHGRFRARIRVRGKLFWLGNFSTPLDAAAAYSAAKSEMHKV